MVSLFVLAGQEDLGQHMLHPEGQGAAGGRSGQKALRHNPAEAEAGRPGTGRGNLELGELGPDGCPGGTAPEEVAWGVQGAFGAAPVGSGP